MVTRDGGLPGLVKWDADSARRDFIGNLTVWGGANRRSFPWRRTEDPFLVLVAEVLLQRSSAAKVAPVFTEVSRRWPSADRMARARLASLERLVRPLGLVQRAARLRAAAARISEAGRVPDVESELLSLPGVGPYVARSLVALRGGNPPLVDRVSRRVYERYFGDQQTSLAGMWELAHWASPTTGRYVWNWSVLDLASLVCTARRPACWRCPLQAGCLQRI